MNGVQDQERSAPVPRPLIDVPCNSCGARDDETVTVIAADYEHLGLIDDAYARRPFRIARCRRCGLVYLNPRPDNEEIFRYYPAENYFCFAQCPPRGRLMPILYRLMVYLKRRRLLPLLSPRGTLVDFGCGNGHWLRALKEGGLPAQRFVGIDPCEGPIKKLRAAGVEAYVGDEARLGEVVAAGSADLILLIHVIEHVPDPKRLLASLARTLKPGGEIHGVTPNVDAGDRAFFGSYWSGWHPPRHFILFDRPKLAQYAREAGLELVSCDYLMEGASHWAVSAHTWIAEHGWRRRPGQYRLPIYPGLLVLAMMVTLAQKLISRTSVMSFVLRKPAGGAVYG